MFVRLYFGLYLTVTKEPITNTVIEFSKPLTNFFNSIGLFSWVEPAIMNVNVHVSAISCLVVLYIFSQAVHLGLGESLT